MIAETPEASDYTSVQDRIESEKTTQKTTQKAASSCSRSPETAGAAEAAVRSDQWLAPIYLDEQQAAGPVLNSGGTRASDKGFLPMMLADYLKLVDWTGRQIVNGKRGRIPAKCQPILERLGLEREVWCDLVKDFGRLFGRVAGRPQSLADSAAAGGVSHRRSHGGAAMLASE